MVFACSIESLTFQDGSVEELPTNGITVVVGPNNVGKSVLLRDISALLAQQPSPQLSNQLLLLDSLTVRREGAAEDLFEWFRANGWPTRSDRNRFNGDAFYGSHQQNPLSQAEARISWQNTPSLGRLSEFLVSAQMTDSRLQLLGGTGVHDLVTDNPRHPLQRLYSNEELEARLSRLTERAFGHTLSINRYVPQIDLRIGKPTLPLTAPPPSPELLIEYAELPFVSSQGDGVKSFTGLLLHIIVPGPPVVLIDEPEAFLHPPQARLLGRILMDQTPTDSQVIVATHSQDFLQGVLESTARPVKIIRLTRSPENELRRKPLEPVSIASLWSDPLIRYSQLLDGLFHAGVVLCESDADCRLYAAVADERLAGRVEHDLLFTHVGGKARLHKAVREVAQFGIDVAVIADLDLLNDEALVRATLQAVGGSWHDAATDFTVLRAAVAGLGTAPLTSEVRNQVLDKLGEPSAGQRLTKEQSAGIQAAVRFETGWDEVKRGGVAAIPQADASAAVQRLIQLMAGHGVFLVPVGELERWYPTVPGKSAPWVASVLEGGMHQPPTPMLADFMDQVLAHFGLTAPAP